MSNLKKLNPYNIFWVFVGNANGKYLNKKDITVLKKMEFNFWKTVAARHTLDAEKVKKDLTSKSYVTELWCIVITDKQFGKIDFEKGVTFESLMKVATAKQKADSFNF